MLEASATGREAGFRSWVFVAGFQPLSELGAESPSSGLAVGSVSLAWEEVGSR